MQRMRARRATISPHDAASRLHTLGVDVYFGEARFLGTDALDVDGQRLRFKRAVIATGGRAALPPVPGLSSVPILTNETLFSLTERPARLAVIGAGPIGCEMAQAFARFGSAVTVFDMSPRVLPREDADAAAVIEAALERDGVVLALGVTLLDIAHARGAFRIGFQNTSGVREAAFDQVLVCAGRAPNLEQLDLTAAAVSYTTDGVQVDERLRTSNHRIYAAGDVCSQFKFTHAADAMARIVIHNALFFGRKRASALTIPWCTYTDPEVAHVGINQLEARERGPSVATITIALADVDRAIVDDATAGFVRIHHERGRLLGCTVVASHAGEMIGEVAYAMTHKGSLSNLSATIHPYPTQAEAFRKAGDAYRRAAVTPTVSRWLRRYFAWTR